MEFENLLKLIQTVSESKLTGFRYEEDGVKICLKKEHNGIQAVLPAVADGRRAAASAPAASASEAATQTDALAGSAAEDDAAASAGNTQSAKIVKSPLVGVFYTAPSEDAEPYVSVGDTVKKGQVLAGVEAMKLMNEIESEYDGVVAEILAQNGQGVGYGEPLFVIR